MSENTKIEWCDHTFNPWEGCQAVSPGCDNCYAEARNVRFGGGKAVNFGPGAPRRRTSAANWRLPLKWNAQADALMAQHGRRQRVFCASLADVFDNAVPAEWRADLFALIVATPNLDWLLLTKRIGNVAPMLRELRHGADSDLMLLDMMPLPNVWIGATIVNQTEADRDIPKLLAIPAAKRFLSMEPLLGPVDLSRIQHPKYSAILSDSLRGNGWKTLDWVIVGGESGPHARPMHPAWARSLRDQCADAGVPFLFKQWGEWLPTGGGDFCRSPTAPEHAKFREKHGRGGYEFAGKAGVSMLRDGRIFYTEPAGDIWHRGGKKLASSAAVECLRHYIKTGANDPGYQWMYRVGKRAAGRLLDGIEHNGFPLAPAKNAQEARP